LAQGISWLFASVWSTWLVARLLARTMAKSMKKAQQGVAKAAGKKQVRKAVTKRPTPKASKKAVPAGLGKIRIGIIHGKDFDPIKVGTQDRNYPEKLKKKDNKGANASGWGGQFHADVSCGLKIARLHPDIFEIDFMDQDQVTVDRVNRNHMTFNLWGDISIATMNQKPKAAANIRAVQTRAEELRHLPTWDGWEWVLHKNRYMNQCMKAGIPMIPTIFIDGEFNAKAALKEIVKRGWPNFFVKPGYMAFFGSGAINGKTQDFVNDIGPLLEYEKEQKKKKQKEFLVQPYMLKPDGNVFDEIRNFFIDGEWCYSVFTHGTDYDGFYEQPEGPLKEACKKLAMRAAAEAQKVSTWEGKQVNTLLNRIDIGIIPDKSKLGYKIFVNEIEMQLTTWLGRYCPFDIVDKMGHACVKKTRQLLAISLAKGRKIPNADKVRKLLAILDERLGPLKA